MARIGMDSDLVRATAQSLDRAADDLEAILNSVNRESDRLASIWAGPDASQFSNEWWPEHRRTLIKATQSIRGLSRSALHNVEEQERASGSGPGSGGGVGNLNGPILSPEGGAQGIRGGIRSDMLLIPVPPGRDPLPWGSATPNPGRDAWKTWENFISTPIGAGWTYEDWAKLYPGVDPLFTITDVARMVESGGIDPHVVVDLLADLLKKSPTLAGQLGGLGITIWNDVARWVIEADLSQDNLNRVWDYIWTDPGDAAAGALAGLVKEVPEFLSWIPKS